MKVEAQHAWHVDPNERDASTFQIARWFLALQEVFAWHLGTVVDAMSFRRTEEGWSMRVQGRQQRGNKPTRMVVTWFHGSSPVGCLWVAARLVRRNEVSFSDDKYPVFPYT